MIGVSSHPAFLDMNRSLGQLLGTLDPTGQPFAKTFGELWAPVRAAYDAPISVQYRMAVCKLGLTSGTYGKISSAEAAAMFDNFQQFMEAIDRAELAVNMLGRHKVVTPEHPCFDSFLLNCYAAKTALEVMALQMEAVDAAYQA